MRCDHTSDSDVEALFARVGQDHGKLDVLVNNAWGGYEHHDAATFTAAFWEQPFGQRWEGMFLAGLRAAIARAMFGMSTELRPHGIVAVALAPGFMRTERVMAAHAAQPFDLSQTESPEYVGRAVAALAADPAALRKSGETLRVGDLAREYGFTDIDGRQVPPFEIPDMPPSP